MGAIDGAFAFCCVLDLFLAAASFDFLLISLC